jgi:hypothetical protein
MLTTRHHLSAKAGTKIRSPAAVAQLVYFAFGLRATEFGLLLLFIRVCKILTTFIFWTRHLFNISNRSVGPPMHLPNVNFYCNSCLKTALISYGGEGGEESKSC